MPLPKDLPDHHDAELIIKLYELRREPEMRASRAAINKDYWPRTEAEAVAVLKADHPLNAAFRQTATYWEMVFGMARHGIVHGDYLAENSAEGLLLFARAQPWLDAIRAAYNTRIFRHAEWVAAETSAGRTIYEAARARVEKTLASRAS
jgi:hypothetical protein